MRIRRVSRSPGRATHPWEFGVGGLAAFIPVERIRPLGRVRLLAILAVSVAVCEGAPFPGAPALVPVFGTAMILVGGAAAPCRGAGRLLDGAVRGEMRCGFFTS